MHIEKDRAVTMHYTLKNDQGQVMDTSEGKEPLQFIFGAGLIIPGLEKALEGKVTGDKISVVVQPEEGYGVFNDALIGEVSRDLFDKEVEPQIGMPVQAQNPDGSIQVFTIAEIKEETIVLDGNHPLAGQVLDFSVEITDVREATAEELEHGHVHASEESEENDQE
ncbi:MAG: peptidylprolyl isomerase [Spirochaetia bacterium]|nr:peptidylprolyl isomerase [Spirochaetia bacterium]